MAETKTKSSAATQTATVSTAESIALLTKLVIDLHHRVRRLEQIAIADELLARLRSKTKKR